MSTAKSHRSIDYQRTPNWTQVQLDCKSAAPQAAMLVVAFNTRCDSLPCTVVAVRSSHTSAFKQAVLVLTSCWLLGGAASGAAQQGMDLDQLTALVQELAGQPYDETARSVPPFLNQLGYDEYRDFKFRLERRLWHGEGLPFEVSFFHPGYLYRKGVTMHVIDDSGSVAELPFSSDMFEYGPQSHLIAQLPDELGFSGFHLWQPGETARQQRVGLFQGASYFRMVSSTKEYGLSGRALAIDTTVPEPEEFPDFTDFWLRQPAADAVAFEFLGLAEGPSVVAAYRFVLTPGTPIRLHTEARLVLRREVKELGLTPFSTMFWYAESSARRPADFRPEVHDSDGLFVETAGERVWRPLVNPASTRTDILPGNELVAFGLQQRDRDYEHYQDIEANYQLRPDAWVVPGEGMEAGTLRLLEIESPHEYADNVALVWVPAVQPQPGEVFAWSYDVYFGERPAPPVATVVATRYGESLRGDGSIEFVIDFAGGALDGLAADSELQIDAGIEGGEFIWQNIRHNPYNDTWRLSLRVDPGDRTLPVRLRAALLRDDRNLSETWTYWWSPSR